MTEAMDIPDDVLEKLSDYLDGALPADAKAEVDKKLAEDALWKRAHEELVETRGFLSGMQKARAPATFAQDVTGTIHKRSAGRFFGRRTVGDHVPFNALLIVAMIAILVIAWIMWTSSTGSLKSDPPPSGGDPGSAKTEPLKH